MTAMSSELLGKLKASLTDPDAQWQMQGAMSTARVEQMLSGSGETLTSTDVLVTNDSYRMASAPLGLQLVFLAEYTPDTIRSISLTFQGIALTTTDGDLLTMLRTAAAQLAAIQDAAMIAALTP